MKNYQNQTVLVTGASKGLGEQFARELAKQGANLVLVARSEPALLRLAGELERQYKVKVAVLPADLSDSQAPERLVGELDQMRVDIDVLVNNAGLGMTGAFLSNDLSRELESLQVNIQATVALSHLVGTRLIARKSTGGIINVASNAAFQPLPHMASYAASKAFVLHFTEALRHELEDSNIRVMAAAPGSTATSFFEGVSVKMADKAFDRADVVARRILQDFLDDKPVSYPGRFSVRLATLLPRLMPRAAIVKIAAGAMAKMGLAA